jgi:hypothetical protein
VLAFFSKRRWRWAIADQSPPRFYGQEVWVDAVYMPMAPFPGMDVIAGLTLQGSDRPAGLRTTADICGLDVQLDIVAPGKRSGAPQMKKNCFEITRVNLNSLCLNLSKYDYIRINNTALCQFNKLGMYFHRVYQGIMMSVFFMKHCLQFIQHVIPPTRYM